VTAGGISSIGQLFPAAALLQDLSRVWIRFAPHAESFVASNSVGATGPTTIYSLQTGNALATIDELSLKRMISRPAGQYLFAFEASTVTRSAI
jgi:hypothetical protein